MIRLVMFLIGIAAALASVAEQSIAAATAVVGYDLLANDINNQSTRPRLVKQAGLAGSAAAVDTKIDLYFGKEVVASMFNVATGAVQSNSAFRNVNKLLPAGTQIRALVTDAPATNPINIVVEFDD